MARGEPDYGAYQPKRFGATLADMGDLAVRLGSIVEYDRRGDIVSLDDFEATILKWSRLAVGGGVAVLDSTTAKSGSQSVKLSTAAVLASGISIWKSFVVLGTLQVGIEISLCSLGANMDFTMTLHYWDGLLGRQARIRYDNSLDTIFVQDGVVGNWTIVANVGAMRRAEQLFYPFKLVADFDTNLYVRFLYGGNEYNLSSITIPPLALVGGAYYHALIGVSNDLAVAGDAWVDDFIMTQNEP